MKVRDLQRWLAEDGWGWFAPAAATQQVTHPVKSDLVTAAGYSNDGLAPGTLNSILKQAGLKTSGQE